MLAILREELGYHVPEPALLNARHFGLAQNRERIFLVGFAQPEPAARFAFPQGNGRTAVFGDVREPAAVSARYYLSDRYLETLRRHRQRHESKGNGFGYEVIGDQQVANTLVLGGMGRERNLVHDPRLEDDTPETRIIGRINSERIRRMTPREWARLQGFPESYKIPVSDTQAYRQFANAVPVPMVQAVGAAVRQALHP
jgi:DNA (cytosine-5)-methyltransferase 1